MDMASIALELGGIRERLGSIDARMENLEKGQERVEGQVRITNGRVTELETQNREFEAIQETRKSIFSPFTKTLLTILGSVGAAVGGAFILAELGLKKP